MAGPVLRNSTFYASGEILGRFAVFALLPVTTRLLPPDQLAIYGLGAVLAQGLTVFYGLGTQTGLPQQQYALLGDEAALRRRNGAALAFLLLWVPTLHLVLEAVGPPLLARFLPTLPWSPYGRLVSLTAALSVAALVPIARWTTREEPMPYVALSLVKSLLEVGATLALLLGARLGVLALFLGRAVAHGLVALPLLWTSVRIARPAWRARELGAVFAFSLPLVPDLLATWALTMGDRLLLAWLSDDHQLGLYTAAYWFPLGLSLVAINVNRAWAPRFHRAVASGDATALAATRAVSTGFVGGMVLLGAATASLAPSFVRLLFGPDYVAAAPLAGVLGLVGLLLGAWQVAIAPLFAAQRGARIAAITGSAALANLLAGLLLIPRWGAIGAAISTVGSYLLLVGLALLAGRSLPRPPVDHRLVLDALVGAAGAAALTASMPVDRPLLVLLVGGAVYAALGVGFARRLRRASASGS